MNKVTTHKLDLDFDLELDFVLIGISSSLRDYRLCHFINKYTGLNFVFGRESNTDHKGNIKSKPQEELDYHIITEKSRSKEDITHHYQVYRYVSQNFDYEYYILNNKSVQNGVLIPEASNFDYFMIIKHYIDQEYLDMLLDNLKKIDDIMLVKEINPTILKSKENLIF